MLGSAQVMQASRLACNPRCRCVCHPCVLYVAPRLHLCLQTRSLLDRWRTGNLSAFHAYTLGPLVVTLPTAGSSAWAKQLLQQDKPELQVG